MAVLKLPVGEGGTVRMVGSEGVVSLLVSSGNPLLVQPGNPNAFSCRLLLPCVKGQRKDVGIQGMHGALWVHTRPACTPMLLILWGRELYL